MVTLYLQKLNTHKFEHSKLRRVHGESLPVAASEVLTYVKYSIKRFKLPGYKTRKNVLEVISPTNNTTQSSSYKGAQWTVTALRNESNTRSPLKEGSKSDLILRLVNSDTRQNQTYTGPSWNEAALRAEIGRRSITSSIGYLAARLRFLDNLSYSSHE